jgi:copper(I)-binding protein
MPIVRASTAFAVLLWLIPSAHAADIKAGDLVISQAWSRATPKGATVAGGYLTIRNQGQTPDRLIAVTSPAGAKADVHEMSMEGTTMRMRPVKDGLAIPPGQTVTLEPSGYHLMVTGLKAPLQQGDTLPATLTFEKAGKVDVPFEVRGIGAGKPMGHM